MIHVCTSIGKFFRSMGQARVRVILGREDRADAGTTFRESVHPYFGQLESLLQGGDQ